MCTALKLKLFDGNYLFGRNMDLEYSFNQCPIIVPRGYKTINKVNGEINKTKYASIGMANICDGHPLYAEAMNEEGLGCAGLNYPESKVENNSVVGMINMAPYDFILWVVSNFKSIDEVKNYLERVNFVGVRFTKELPLPTLHWMITDKYGLSLVVEKDEDGLKVYENKLGVLTNSPNFNWHLNNLSLYSGFTTDEGCMTEWDFADIKPKFVGGASYGIPGDCSSPSRFVKIAYLNKNINISDDYDTNIIQFFHMLHSVSMVKGFVKTKDGINDITQYTSCMDLQSGIYYYNTYDNYSISKISLFSENLDTSSILRFKYNNKPFFTEEN